MTGVDLLHVPYTGGGPAVTRNHRRSGAAQYRHHRWRAAACAQRAVARNRGGPRQAAHRPHRTCQHSRNPVCRDTTTVPGTACSPPPKRRRWSCQRFMPKWRARCNCQTCVKTFANEGVEVVASTPEVFAATVRGELAMWPRVVKAAGIKPE